MAVEDFEQARDAICGQLRTAWLAGTPALMGHYGNEAPKVAWPNVPREDGATPLQEGNKPWARFTVRHTDAGRQTLGAIGEGRRLFGRKGLLSLQVFVPTAKRGLVDADRLAKVAVDAFEGKSAEGVLFTNVAYREVGSDDAWYQVNVTANFSWDARK